MDLNTTILTIATALIGILCGAAAGSYFNLRTGRKDLLFKRKLEYFEKLSRDMEENLRLHKKAILPLSKSSKAGHIEQKLLTLKKERKNFLIMASPLYFDTSIMTEKIIYFVNVEKSIFSALEKLAQNPAKSAKAKMLFDIREHLQKLTLASQEIIQEMKRELYQR